MCAIQSRTAYFSTTSATIANLLTSTSSCCCARAQAQISTPPPTPEGAESSVRVRARARLLDQTVAASHAREIRAAVPRGRILRAEDDVSLIACAISRVRDHSRAVLLARAREGEITQRDRELRTSDIARADRCRACERRELLHRRASLRTRLARLRCCGRGSRACLRECGCDCRGNHRLHLCLCESLAHENLLPHAGVYVHGAARAAQRRPLPAVRELLHGG